MDPHSRSRGATLAAALLLLAAAPLLLPGCCSRRGPGQLASLLKHKDLPSDTAELLELADELAAKRPRTVYTTSRAMAALEKAVAMGYPRSFELMWRLSRASVMLVELLPEKRTRYELARRGGKAALEAAGMEPDRVEGHYYLAQCVARMAEAQSKMKYIPYFKIKTEVAARIDARFDDAGPLRFLGKLYLTAPAWPVSVGSSEKAVEILERALEIAPVPVNRLFLGQAYYHDEEYEDAADQIRRALADGRKRGLEMHWIAEGERYLRMIRAEEASPPGSRLRAPRAVVAVGPPVKDD